MLVLLIIWDIIITIILNFFYLGVSGDVLSQESFQADFFTDELDPLDFDACQLLSSATIGIPESTEDDFRLEHRS